MPIVQRCSSIIVGKNATADRSVILAHNEDLGSYMAQQFLFTPRATHKAGEVVNTYFGAKVPQVSETFAYSATKIFDKSYVPGDITSGINEYQVAVVNNMSYRRDAPPELPTTGRIIWTEFTQFALERAKTAREAVKLIGDLAQKYKLGADSGTMIGVTDTSEGWWIEVTMDGQWVAQRVPDNSAVARANIFRIGVVDLNDHQNFMYSPDLVEYAKSHGWYGTGPFDFAMTYGDPTKLDSPYNTRRVWRADALLHPFINKIEPKRIISVLRDHYEGTQYDQTNGYTRGSPHQTDERTLCSINTEVSAVFQSRGWLPAEIGGICWRAMATPCTSIYVPWYFGSRTIPSSYQIGTNSFTAGSAYWTFREISRYNDVRYGSKIGKIADSIKRFEEQEFNSQGNVENVAIDLYKKDPSLACKYLSDHSAALATKALFAAKKFTE